MQDYNHGMAPYDQPAPSRTGGIPLWLIVLLSVVGVLVVAVCGGLIWLVASFSASPDTFVYTGNQVPPAFVEAAQDLGIVDPSEQVLFLYSDAMLDVKDAMYILTDQHLVLHNKAWSDPQRVIAFDEVVAVTASWSDDWLLDSMITVELSDGSFWTFPLSMENDTDHRFVEELCQSAGVPTPP